MLDFRIKTFLCVCQTMNYTQAAKLLNITQPAVSQHIRFLEDYYQIKAFRYANKKLELTAAGRILYERCKTMENDEVALSAELLSSQSGIRTLSLGVTMTVGEYAIISPLAAYQLAHPGINIRLRFGNTQELLAQLTAGRIQMALVEGYFPPQDYFCRPYSTEPYIGVCASSHVFPSGEPATFHDLLGARLLLREKGSGTREILERNLALHGRESFEKVSSMAEYARAEINEIGGFYAYGRELIDGDSVFDFDVTKLSVFTQGIGMTGIEVYDMLRDEYDIQIEFGDIGNILAYISIGDRIRDIERLVGALEDIADRAGKDKKELYCGEFIAPELVMSPREAFYAQGEKLPLEKTVGRVAGEMLMCYPPGIPILTPGERITQEILDYIEYAREKGCSLQGTQDLECREMRILTEI